MCIDLDAAQQAKVRAAAGSGRVFFERDFSATDAARQAFESCDICFGNPPGDWVKSSPALRWLQLESVGFGEYADIGPTLRDNNVAVTNLAGFFAQPVAESILAGILALYRGIDRLSGLRRARSWVGDDIRKDLRLLSGARTVLFGRGTINAKLAGLLQPFGCAITSFGSDWLAKALDQALAATDILVTTVPHTAATEGVFDRNRLALLPKGALFVNFGRGSAVDENALADALEAGRLGGAVIDVTEAEPLPPDHRFWVAPNLVLTQHSGGGTADEIDRKIDVFIDNLSRFRRGDTLVGIVDFSKGY